MGEESAFSHSTQDQVHEEGNEEQGEVAWL
jgi:hypothetical protein